MQSAWAAKKKKLRIFQVVFEIFLVHFFEGNLINFREKYSIKVDDVMNKNLSSTHMVLFLCLFLFLFFFLHLSSRYFCHKYFANHVYTHSRPELRLSIKKGIQVNSTTKRFEGKDTFRDAHQRYRP